VAGEAVVVTADLAASAAEVPAVAAPAEIGKSSCRAVMQLQ
jgi:hypothetical protein